MPKNKLLLGTKLGRSGIGIIGGIAGLVLAIIALAGTYRMDLAAIATIAIAVAFLFEGAAVVADYNAVMSSSETTVEKTEFVGGISAEMLAGATGIVLGVLSLLGIISNELIPVAVIVYGASLVIGAGVVSQLEDHKLNRAKTKTGNAAKFEFEAAGIAAGTQILVGLAAIVLGIIALSHVNALQLSIIGLLVIGAGMLLSNSAIGGKMMTMFK